jgi:hypothetical protein
MTNLIRSLTILSLVLGIISPSFANGGIKNEEQFQGDPEPKNCPLQKRRQGKFIYDLCQVKGKPIVLYINSIEGASGDESETLDVAVLTYKNGQLIKVGAEDFHRYGFRNNKLVAAWHLNKTITNLSSSRYRTEEKRFLAESRKALGLFGIKQK